MHAVWDFSEFICKNINIGSIINHIDIKKYANKNNSKIITTEKDYLRIDKQLRNDISYIEMDLEIIDENKFLQLIS